MGRDVIIACDFNSKEEVVSFLSKFQDEKPFVKIGMELFYAEGPEIVRTIKNVPTVKIVRNVLDFPVRCRFPFLWNSDSYTSAKPSMTL